ncbi:MAG: AlpA family transcriptional regulator [SAR324 cluster bacterium]|nr:AlpA family transcriptional regulator [SAR324 cluster bacterium]
MDNSKNTTPKQKHRFIRLNEVLSRTGFGRTSIYRKMEEGSFPKSLKLGGPPKDPSIFDSRAVAWIEDEVDQWMESRIDDRDSV